MTGNWQIRVAWLLFVLLLLPTFVACGGDSAMTTGASTTRTPTVVTTAGKTEPPVTTGESTVGTTENVTTVPLVTEPSTTTPPITEPPVTEPPVTEPPVTEPPVTEPPVTEPPVTEPPVVYDRLCLVENGVARYRLVNPSGATMSMIDIVRAFNEKFASMTGVEMELLVDSLPPENNRELVVCATRNRAGAMAIADSVKYTEYGMATDGERLVLTAYRNEDCEAMLSYLLRAMYLEGDRWYVDSDFVNFTESYCEPLDFPKYNTRFGRLDSGSVYSTMEGTVVASYRGTNREECDAYIKKLCDEGFSKYFENTIGEVSFVTYTKGTSAVHLQFNPKKNVLTLCGFKDQFLPSNDVPTYTKLADTGIHFLKRYGFESGGMSMILQLSDGTFIIIDGGKSYDTDRRNMIDFLLDNKPAEHEKPIVSLWLMTHPHEDHVEMFAYDAEIFAQYIELRMMGYNFPIEPCSEVDAKGRYWNEYYHHALDAKRQEFFPDSTLWVTHTGQKMRLADAEIEVLYTLEDYYPGKIYSANDCNTNFRITVDGVSLIVLGDTDSGNAEMVEMYGDALEADFVQTAHHGHNGPASMYFAIDAKVVFWPTSAEYTAIRFTEPQNEPWVNTLWSRVDAEGKQTSGTRLHYTASETTHIYFADYSED